MWTCLACLSRLSLRVNTEPQPASSHLTPTQRQPMTLRQSRECWAHWEMYTVSNTLHSDSPRDLYTQWYIHHTDMMENTRINYTVVALATVTTPNSHEWIFSSLILSVNISSFWLSKSKSSLTLSQQTVKINWISILSHYSSHCIISLSDFMNLHPNNK